MRILVIALIALLATVQYQLWIGEDSLVGLWQLQKAVEMQQSENLALRERNDQLAAEVEDLKTGLVTVEDRARSELGMIHKKETYYQIVDR